MTVQVEEEIERRVGWKKMCVCVCVPSDEFLGWFFIQDWRNEVGFVSCSC